MHACDKLSLKDYGDRQIRHRIAKYVDRQRAKFEEFGFVMEKDANLEMSKRCILPSANFIIRRGAEPEKRRHESTSTSAPEDQPLEKRPHSQERDGNPQDEILVGSEAADLVPTQPHLPMPGMGRRSTSPHALSALEKVALEVEEERKKQEEIVRKQREQMEQMQRKFDAEARRKEMQRQQEEKIRMDQEKVRREEEEEQVRQLQRQLETSRKEFEELRRQNEQALEAMRDAFQQQIIDSEPDQGFQPVNNRKKKSPPKVDKPANPLARPISDFLR